MKNNEIIKWVQLSDLHFFDSTSQNLQQNFLAKLNNVSFVVITGDLKQYDQNYDRTVSFLTKIKKSIRLENDCLFFVPGNHDITHYDGRNKYIKRIDKNTWNDADYYMRYRNELVNAYFEYLEMAANIVGDRFYTKEDMLFSMKTWNDKLNILHINSSLLCDKNSDKKQIVDIYGLSELIPNGLPTIVIMHHDFYSLSPNHQELLKRILLDLNAKACLSGHIHHISERNIKLPDGTLIPNIVSGKTLSQPGDHGSDCNIIVYEWNQKNNTVTAKPYMWATHRFNPSFCFNTDEEINQAIHGICFSLNETISQVAGDTYETIDTEKLLAEIITYERPVSPSDSFIGRETIIQDIEKALVEERKIVLLNGIGGMGKSEICREIFERYSVRSGTSVIKQLGWVTYRETLEKTFFKQLPGIKIDSDDDKNYWLVAKNHINQLGANLLLFVDDANEIREDETLTLSQLGCRLILTSRSKLDRIKHIEVGSLSIEDCVLLYRKHNLSEGDTFDDDVIKDIISLTAGHTLSIELLAKTQLVSGCSSQELLESLQKTGFDLSDTLAEVNYLYHPEQVQGHVQDTYKRFIVHMEKIFDIAGISDKPQEIIILQLFSMLAANQPVPTKDIIKWFVLNDPDALNRVIQKGWLIRNSEEGVSMVSMHPIISAVIQRKEMQDKDILEILFANVAKDLELSYNEVFLNKMGVFVHAASIISSISSSSISYSDLLQNAAIISQAKGDSKKALEWYEKALAIREKVLGKEHPSTAITYNNIADVYGSEGDYEKALEWYGKALAINEKALERENPSLAATYNNIALVYSDQGNYEKALEWYGKALDISENVLGKEHPDTATTYHNIALVYFGQGNYEKALKWYGKALAINEKVLGKEHPDTAITYSDIAGVYDSQGEYEKALEWNGKALAIREKVLGMGHPDTATTYNNIAFVYSGQGDYEKALEWNGKALAIREKVLGREHPDTAITYNNIARIYFFQGENEKALEWQEKALRIFKQCFGAKHPYTISVLECIEHIKLKI